MEREDKHMILHHLIGALQCTRQYADLIGMEYDNQKEIVTMTYAGGQTQTVNVAMDSGAAMIRDILRQTA